MNNLKKTFIIIFVLTTLVASLIPPTTALAEEKKEKEGLVPCGGPPPQKPCTLDHLIGTKGIVQTIVNIVVKQIVPALATILLIIGGLVLLTSGGSPERVNLGKKILFSAIVGLVLALGAWAIIRFILQALGAKSKYIP